MSDGIPEALRKKILSEKEISVIKVKVLSKRANSKEINSLLVYIMALEMLVDDDFYGFAGWRKHLGWEEA